MKPQTSSRRSGATAYLILYAATTNEMDYLATVLASIVDLRSSSRPAPRPLRSSKSFPTLAHARGYIGRAKRALAADRPETFSQLLEELKWYEKDHLPMHVVYRNMAQLLSQPGDEDLLRDFLRFFPSSSCIGLPESLTGAWRRSHRIPRSHILIEQDAYEAEQEALAVNQIQRDVAMALHKGDTQVQHRAALPMEIVLRIMRYSSAVVQYPVRILKTTPTVLPAGATGRVSVRAHNNSDVSKLVCSSEPLDRAALAKMATIQVLTISQDQGWTTYVHHRRTYLPCANEACRHANEGSQSWFELGILDSSSTGEDALPRRAWVSHHNKIAGEDLQEHIGIEFDISHPIWEELRAGDRLGVWAHAQHQAWQCHVSEVELRYWQWFGSDL
jgi:hypothetical protein